MIHKLSQSAITTCENTNCCYNAGPSKRCRTSKKHLLVGARGNNDVTVCKTVIPMDEVTQDTTIRRKELVADLSKCFFASQKKAVQKVIDDLDKQMFELGAPVDFKKYHDPTYIDIRFQKGRNKS